MTLQADLIAAGLPIESATEMGTVIWQRGAEITPDQVRLCADMITQYTDPVAYADLLVYRADIDAIKDAYAATIARLDQIQAAGNQAFTQAGFNLVQQALRDNSLYIERIYKFLAQRVKNGNDSLSQMTLNK